MLSKGGKISYLCPSCDSPTIVNTAKGLSVQGKLSYVRVPANLCLCVTCGEYTKWASRKKVKALPEDTFDGVCNVDHYQELCTKVKNIRPIDFSQQPTSLESTDCPTDTTKPAIKKYNPPIQRGIVTELGIVWSPTGKEDFSHWTHTPHDFGVWVVYNSWRFKDVYDIMLTNGTIEKMCYPNADQFSNVNGPHSEYDVVAVRLCDYDDVKDTWRAGGNTKAESDEYRARRNSSMFAGDDTTKDSWGKVKTIRFDPETKQLIDDDIDKYGDV